MFKLSPLERMWLVQHIKYSTGYYKVHRLLQCTYNFFKWGWRCRKIHAWDYNYLLWLMEMQFADMEEALRNYDIHERADRTAQICMTLKNLCKRLAEENHKQQDLDLLCKLLNKHLFKLWT